MAETKRLTGGRLLAALVAAIIALVGLSALLADAETARQQKQTN